eukprot:383386-Heterocapsa_arctica.AAC.1
MNWKRVERVLEANRGELRVEVVSSSQDLELLEQIRRKLPEPREKEPLAELDRLVDPASVVLDVEPDFEASSVFLLEDCRDLGNCNVAPAFVDFST